MLRIYDESIAESNVCVCTQPVHRSLTIIQNSIYTLLALSSTEEELLLLQAMTATIYLHTNKSLSHSVEKMQI
jgi:hypothetical protein